MVFMQRRKGPDVVGSFEGPNSSGEKYEWKISLNRIGSWI